MGGKKTRVSYIILNHRNHRCLIQVLHIAKKKKKRKKIIYIHIKKGTSYSYIHMPDDLKVYLDKNMD